MATGSEDFIASDEMEESKPTVSEDLNCPLCLKVFRSPRRLRCLHSFCQDCLQSHISSTASIRDAVKELCCPICGIVAWSGEFSTDKLVHLFPLNMFILSILMKSGSKVKVDLLCNVCQVQDVISPAEDLCTICEEALCIQCSKVHRSLRLSTTHTIMKTEDLPCKQETLLQNNHMFHCTEHASFPVELYCKGHETQLCVKCLADDHANCSEVIKLANEIPNLSDALNQMKEQIQKLEGQLKKFTNISLSNLNKLQSDINGLTIEIRTLKKTINDALDDLEKRANEECNKIFNEEKKRIEKFSHGFQCHITAIRNFSVVVESASKYATHTQTFVLTQKIRDQLSETKSHIDDKYSKNDILTLQLEVHPQLKSVINIPRGEIGMLKMKRNDEIAVVPDGFKPLKECMAELVNVTDIKGLNDKRFSYTEGLDDKTPWYTRGIYTSNNQLLLLDYDNNMLYLLDSSFTIVCFYRFLSKPWDVCMVSAEVAAVTLPLKKSIDFLSLKDKSITYVKEIQTKYKCFSIATYSHEELIVSGPCGNSDKYYWSLITLDGMEKSYHEFDGEGTCQTYVALNAFNTRLYISVWKDNSVHCFGLDKTKHFTFTHNDLKGPESVSVDRDDNVYVVGCVSQNIFQLTPDGSLIQIILNGIEQKPMGICFDQHGDRFVLYHLNNTCLSHYKLVDKERQHSEENQNM